MANRVDDDENAMKLQDPSFIRKLIADSNEADRELEQELQTHAFLIKEQQQLLLELEAVLDERVELVMNNQEANVQDEEDAYAKAVSGETPMKFLDFHSLIAAINVEAIQDEDIRQEFENIMGVDSFVKFAEAHPELVKEEEMPYGIPVHELRDEVNVNGGIFINDKAAYAARLMEKEEAALPIAATTTETLGESVAVTTETTDEENVNRASANQNEQVWTEVVSKKAKKKAKKSNNWGDIMIMVLRNIMRSVRKVW